MAVWMDNLTVVRIDGDETNVSLESTERLHYCKCCIHTYAKARKGVLKGFVFFWEPFS